MNETLETITHYLSQRKLENEKEFRRELLKACEKYGVSKVPGKITLLQAFKKLKLEPPACLVRKPVRSISGIRVVTVVTEDKTCAWGKCIYCPKFDAPKSYTGLEPAIQRAKRNNYDAFLQVKDRLEQYKLMGHLSEKNKIEIIILGGTFMGMPKSYRENFVKGIFDALNDRISSSLEEAKRVNETFASNKCVNFIVETRPDFCFEEHVDEMLSYGVTGVEIGVQSVYEDVLRLVRRGHGVEEVVRATKVARNAGLKVGYHIMPNLPGSSVEKDLKMFKELFSNPNFRPDYLKIYPTLVLENTELYEMWKRGEYKPYGFEELLELLAECKKYVPKYCRIQRLGRDIPSTKIVAGYKKTNLREYVKRKCKELGIECKCIRCREAGFKLRDGKRISWEDVELCRLDYEANGGREIFLSFEDVSNDILLGFLRLRIPPDSHREEIDGSTSIVRELKVVGFHVGIDETPASWQVQHRGFGRKLLEEAERISRDEFGKEKIVVISGIGVRNYYRKLGYELEGAYMRKFLK